MASAVFLLLADPQALDFTRFPGLPLPGLVLLAATWLMLTGGILLRLIPNKYVPIGAGKHFSARYLPSGADVPVRAAHAKKWYRNGAKGAAKVAVFWVALNTALFAGLAAAGWLLPGTAIVLALVFAVVDRLFVRFFCPFRTFFMKNDCCTVCRIYNWDYMMICTPLIMFPSFFSLTLAAMALVLLVRWEWAIKNRPHFFMRAANLSLRCDMCQKPRCRSRSGDGAP